MLKQAAPDGVAKCAEAFQLHEAVGTGTCESPLMAAQRAHLLAVRCLGSSALGKPPGGDIFIHGGPRGPITQPDWTAGCISVTDRQMEVVYAMVKPGTPIWILK